MIKRILTALLIIAVVIPPLVFGGYFLDMLVYLIVIIAGFEIFNLLANCKFISTGLMFLLLSSVFFIHYLPLQASIVSFSILSMAILSIPIFSHKVTSEDAFFIIAILSMFFSLEICFFSIYNVDVRYIWFVLIATYGCDTGAYFIGSQFGRRKLIPSISPNKSIEGAVGGWVTGALMSFIFVVFVFPTMPLLAIILGCLWLPITSQFGDLTFSAMKRHFNIKDFSNVFPGHGGFMDRIDSLVFNVIVFALILELALW
ncbi:MAG: phosphatidate cytidylyltransferase [Breznakia sp.]